MQALFRLVEPVPGSQLVIDGVDVLKLGLEPLRQRLTIIPQDPVMFAGTVRYNLDPFDQFTDETIWQVLAQVNIKAKISGLPNQLLFPITEDGENLSVGERQLLCVARALLRKTNILILDEATASVDMESDRLINEVVREQFRDCTVLAIAHRLSTIIDYDRILVLDSGNVEEFEEPHLLLQNPNSYFRKMVDATGPGSSAFLIESARKAYDRKHAPPQNIF
eukprot:TRINITY_DN7200_c0_g1_i7.p1 TRINITY_DN7200_c0_g1~~TRINITY_DN7200_c0_g1_i7.p1  ORF type:complete len:222 (-),score=49.63 TRINITY_DN7200_c0_g1_i7:91-756(-)